MGSIQHVYSPDKWEIVMEGKSKIVPDDYIYKLVIGNCYDELSYGLIYEFISKEVYESILNGKYSYKAFPYSVQKLVVYDENKNAVSLVRGYSFEQKTYVKK